MPLLRLKRWRACALFFGVVAQAEPFNDRIELLFRPPLAEQIALAPDGQHVAYTRQNGDDLTVVIMNIEYSERRTTLIVDEARGVMFSEDKEPAKLRFLRWATSERLVFSPSDASIMAVDATGLNPKTLITGDEFAVMPSTPMAAIGPDNFTTVSNVLALDPIADLMRDSGPKARLQPRTLRPIQIVGFDPANREQLILSVRSQIRGSSPDQFSLNIHTGKYTDYPDGWVRPTSAPDQEKIASEVRRELARKFPRRTVNILEWSENRARVLCRVSGGSDRGRIFVFKRPENLVVEVLKYAPWLDAAALNETRLFELDASDGTRLSGFLTWPKNTRRNPPPLLVCFPSDSMLGKLPDYDAEAQVFADLGFAVLRLNHRGLMGGKDGDRTTLLAGLDRVPVDDAVAAIEWVAAHYPNRPFDRSRVATLGRGFGGYLAVRALQLRPEVFRCGIAIDAPMDLQPWLYPYKEFDAPQRPASVLLNLPSGLLDRDTTDWKKFSILEHAATLEQPVFLLVQPLRNQAIDVAAAGLRSKLSSAGHPAAFMDLDPGFGRALPKARAATYRKIEEFLNLHIYDYGVKIGPTKVIK